MFSSPSIALSGFHFQAFALDEAFRAMGTQAHEAFSSRGKNLICGFHISTAQQLLGVKNSENYFGSTCFHGQSI